MYPPLHLNVHVYSNCYFLCQHTLSSTTTTTTTTAAEWLTPFTPDFNANSIITIFHSDIKTNTKSNSHHELYPSRNVWEASFGNMQIILYSSLNI